MPLTFKEVAEILKLIDASECDEVVLELEGTRLVVRRNGSPTTDGVASSSASDPGQAPAQSGAEDPAPVMRPQTETPGKAGLLDVRSPMVGTFYRRPSPDEPPFVEEGAQVKKGDTLCLIEVMKLFTAIEAPEDGTVAEIAQDDGAVIEFDQLLFRMRT
ncbi:MAG: acetyl-CoA carboxylase biotin carboxyl carrier protein [Hyphomicrobiaceae bacterium]|nr:acetyl-CoA carboxylase biotin carboxyl carrier protein [Hyphomicrobiaceae bacterium]